MDIGCFARMIDHFDGLTKVFESGLKASARFVRDPAQKSSLETSVRNMLSARQELAEFTAALQEGEAVSAIQGRYVDYFSGSTVKAAIKEGALNRHVEGTPGPQKELLASLRLAIARVQQAPLLQELNSAVANREFLRLVATTVSSRGDKALRMEDLTRLRAILESGSADIDQFNEKLQLPTPLVGACYWGDVDVTRMLLEHGANPRLGDPLKQVRARVQKLNQDVAANRISQGYASRTLDNLRQVEIMLRERLGD